MSYRIRDVLRLHARDTVFLTKYLKEKIVSGDNKQLIICNSFPKSGTHLLYQILYSLPEIDKWDDIISVQALCGIMNTPHHIRWKLGSAPSNSIVRCHLMYAQEILDILSEHRCKLLFIYRDLRDVAVSHARWVNKEERIFLHDIYQKQSSFDERLMSSINGTPLGSPLGSNLSHPSIGQDFTRWYGWLQHSETLSIKFEDLVGERGGGSEEKRLDTIREITDHLGICLSSIQLKKKFTSHEMNPEESHTFKKGGKGAIGNWRNYFTEEHKKQFKKTAGQLLIDMRYEQDLSW